MNRIEQENQIAVMKWAKMQECVFPCLKLLHHIPNGGRRSKAEAGIFKALGVKSGVCDLFLPCARRGFHGLYIEMKTDSGDLSESQREFIALVESEKYGAFVCRCAEDAIKVLRWYVSGKDGGNEEH